ncbi:pentatricopeptide repeat-containing protein [Tanacetum coccineum]|uniref:Pentatricopeptide repeat-containing protein n=1 Tax=Tanacetum coccineum TaxID=301880 RepID=A0ABQ5AB79_9ASTR
MPYTGRRFSWKQSLYSRVYPCRKYDIKVSNVLLGGYIRNGLMEKSEGLHYRTLEKGGCPNYKTWDILIEGYVKNEDMEQAVFAMKTGFRMLKKCKWRPDPVIVESVKVF